MRAQLERATGPNPQLLGVDEISIRNGHVYRIVVCDLHRQRPIGFGREDRSEQRMDEFYRFFREKLGLQGASTSGMVTTPRLQAKLRFM